MDPHAAWPLPNGTMAWADAEDSESSNSLLEIVPCEIDYKRAAAAKDMFQDIASNLGRECVQLMGRMHKQCRRDIRCEIDRLLNGPEYIDACLITKGLMPKHGTFTSSWHGAFPTHGEEEQTD